MEKNNTRNPRRHLVRLAWFWVIGLPILCGLNIVSPVYHPQDSERSLYCLNHMKNIALGVLNYATAKGEIPAYTVDEQGRRLHSWRTLILPYIEEGELYGKIRLDEPWDSEHNRQFHNVVIRIYQCKWVPDKDPPITNYFLVTGPGTLFEERMSKDFDKHIDESNRKLLLIESSSSVHWMCPEDVSLADYEAGLVPPTSSFHRSIAYSDSRVKNLHFPPRLSHFSPYAVFFGYILPCFLFFALILAVPIQLGRFLWDSNFETKAGKER